MGTNKELKTFLGIDKIYVEFKKAAMGCELDIVKNAGIKELEI